MYAQRGANGDLAPTELIPGRDNPQAFGLQKRELPDATIRNRTRALLASGSGGNTSAPAAVTTAGTLKNLVVLIRFSNHATRALPSVANYNTLMNAVGGDPVLAPTGSVRDYYKEASYGILTLDSTVTVWVDLPQTEAYYANANSGLTTRTHEALRSALNALDADPNFSFLDFDQDQNGTVDSIAFIHSGYGAEWGGTSADGANYIDRIWSHKWAISGGWTGSEGVRVYDYHINPGIWGTSGTAIGRIGVICHETGHFLGLPDLYDTNDGGEGIGSYCLMANSWGFDGSQKYPPHPSVWCKTRLGWLTPTLITGAGTYSLPQVETSPAAYRINLGYPSNEYLLIENRQRTGFDAVMPQGGLAIFHIDDNADYNTEGYPGQAGWPQNGNHYRVALLQADGAYNLERGNNRGDRYDVYHAAGVAALGPDTVPNTDAYQGGIIVPTDNRIHNISAAAATMSFAFEVVTSVTPPLAPDGLTATAAGFDRVDLAWVDHADNEELFRIERSDNGGPWQQIGTTAANATNYADTLVEPATPYAYRVRANNLAGDSPFSNVANATTDPAPAQDIAFADLDNLVAGTLSGSYANTFADDGVVQTITERLSGGKPSVRYSYLDHRWRFSNVRAGVSVTLYVQGWAAANPDNEDFQLQFSLDGGLSWGYAAIIQRGSPANNLVTAALPPEARGTVWIRVVDTNTTAGKTSLDSVTIDELMVVTELDITDYPPTPPTNLTATAQSSSAVALSWTDLSDNERGFTVYRSDNGGTSFTAVGSTPADATSYLDSSVGPGRSYVYQVAAFTFNWEARSGTATVQTPDGISLTGSGTKQRGLVVISLSWTTGPSLTMVNVQRSYNGGAYTTVASGVANNLGGTYTDRTGLKAGTFSYRVTGPNGTPVSNVVQFSF